MSNNTAFSLCLGTSIMVLSWIPNPTSVPNLFLFEAHVPYGGSTPGENNNTEKLVDDTTGEEFDYKELQGFPTTSI